MLARLEPEGAVELSLASRVAEVLWRLRRVARAERQAVDNLQVYRSALLQDSEYVDEHARKQNELNGESDAGEPDAGRSIFFWQFEVAYQSNQSYRPHPPSPPLPLRERGPGGEGPGGRGVRAHHAGNQVPLRRSNC